MKKKGRIIPFVLSKKCVKTCGLCSKRLTKKTDAYRVNGEYSMEVCSYCIPLMELSPDEVRRQLEEAKAEMNK